ncbi:ABC transporter permease [Paenibacillus nasutitermitis]|uniref:Uncharacterized protein n=1 Tax=Paenibacillus nasutitermitis TaxID=1652958 RepID=A0A917DW22_9BACL|nr:ABC transporter permease [Paenibacillus nasutitermitis]GGD72869.1 hypothetical protein GCM10010911_33390 [Paenibacillus nasutitermitis]
MGAVINILKMDFHRFKTNKMLYVLLLIFFAFQTFGIYMLKKYEQPGESGGMPISSMNESQFIQVMMSQTPLWMLIYIAVFSVYFYMSEHNSGFYKNYISMKNARKYSVISKILISGLFTLLMFIVMIVADMIGRSIFFNNVTIGDSIYFAKLLIGQFLLHWAFSIVILCISIISKSLIASIVIGFVLSLNVFGMIVTVLESIIDDVHLSSFLIVNTILSARDFDNINDLVHVASVSIVFILIFSFIAIRYKIKEDLK